MMDIVRIQSMLYDVRDTPIEFVPGPPLEPVWSERSALVRLLSLLLYALRRTANEGRAEGALRVSTESDEQWVRIKLESSQPVSERTVSDYAASLASALGVEWRVGGGSGSGYLEVRLPTLKAHRAAARAQAAPETR